MTGHLQLINQVGLELSAGVYTLLGTARWLAAELVPTEDCWQGNCQV